MSIQESELCKSVKASLDQYFTDLEGELPHAIYDMVITSIERPLLEYVMVKSEGNQSKAAEILGVNRNTLRKKLKLHEIQ